MKKFSLVFAACAVMSAGAYAADAKADKPELARDWVAMDVDRDGHITPDEMVNYEKKKAAQKK
ncbi:hypothetical protein [Methyloversatilis discipulorum]|uniref:hypothetical protein n=1 Tax=Methyloversatilis discipulorum TaxID=1119528 RepID=UPI00037C7E24|nr:hypothetical protein [Methyloversatilis discipulorum]